MSWRVPKNRAPLGQTAAHIGCLPTEVRSQHISHFIISSKSDIILGTPKGQASTQLLQAMQRGLRAERTTPSSFFLMASAGQTSAQVGESQCMHTTGAVWGELARSTYSRWIIGRPLCVSHSPHACTHAWQPMQRLGSMKHSCWSAIAMLNPQPLAAQCGTTPRVVNLRRGEAVIF